MSIWFLLLVINDQLSVCYSFPLIRADRGKDQSLFLQQEMVEGTLITVLTMDMPTVCLLLLFPESVEMAVSLDMLRGVQL